MIDGLPPSAAPQVPLAPPANRPHQGADFGDLLKQGRREPPSGAQDNGPQLSMGAADNLPPLPVAGIPDALEAVFGFHVRADTGVVQIFSVPWRLAANSALSHRTHGAYDAIAAMARPAAGSAAGNLESVASAAGFVPVAPLHGPSAARTSTVMPTASATSTRAVAGTDATQAGAASPASVAEPWLARLLRLLTQQGHDPVLWIRDFRLDDAASQSAVADVRALAEQQGLRLERIMVNGREMWNARPTSQHMENP
ncbi:MAG: hypothetical protein M3Q42_00395 [Pseudomonadota bacterium]|nr:hypothetical protein [Pseudomonadota bacterium]